jgi:hypothetical protein
MMETNVVAGSKTSVITRYTGDQESGKMSDRIHHGILGVQRLTEECKQRCGSKMLECIVISADGLTF